MVKMRCSLVVIALFVAGCAMSERSFSTLSTEVSNRNEANWYRAEQQLRTNGYRFLDESELYASVDSEGRARCHAVFARTGSEDPPDGSRVTMTLAPAQRSDGPPVVRTEVRVVERAMCEFVTNHRDQLDVERVDDGRTVHLVAMRSGERLARDPQGALVTIAATPHVVSRRSVLVDRSCDHMPHPPPDALEYATPRRVALVDAPPRRVEMSFDEEVLETRCTRNTY